MWGLSGYNRTGRIRVCFKDRFTAKQVSRSTGTGPTTNTSVCPICREPLVDMGRDFKPPRKRDDREWRRIEVSMLHGHGYWLRQTPRQIRLIPLKRKNIEAIRAGLKGRQESWRGSYYDPETI